MEEIAAFFQHIGRLADQTFIIVTCKTGWVDGKSKFFPFSRLQLCCFLKSDQYLLWLAKFALRCLSVQLYHLPAGSSPCIGYDCVE